MWRQFLLLTFLLPLWGLAQDGLPASAQPGAQGISMSYVPGYMWGHRPVLERYNSFAQAFCVSYNRVTPGTKGWHRSFNNPRIGASVFVHGLGSEIDSYIIGSYPYFELPIVRKRWIDLGFRVGVGLGYSRQTYDADLRPDFRFTGSHLMGAIHPGLFAHLPIAGKLDAQLGLNLAHYSMSNIQMPNLGYNLPTAVLGLQYRFQENAQAVNTADKPTLDDFKRRWYVQVFGAVGTRRMSPNATEDARFTTMSVGGQWMWRLSPTNALGAGMDVFSGRSIYFQHTLDDTSRIALGDQTEVALKLTHELRMGRAALQLALGYYVFSRERHMGPWVQRLGVYFYPVEQLFLGVGLKTHWGFSDYMEFTLGVKI